MKMTDHQIERARRLGQSQAETIYLAHGSRLTVSETEIAIAGLHEHLLTMARVNPEAMTIEGQQIVFESFEAKLKQLTSGHSR